jgi:cytoplasmic iron level regulating protein YaaA (DUF328/UPF0246 family)
MRALTIGDDFETIKDWLHTNLNDNKSFVPCKEELLNLKSKDDSKSKGIYFWFMRPDGYMALSNFVPIQAIKPKYSRIIDNKEYDLVYLGTTGTGKQGKNNFYGRLDWHINQVHRESIIKQKESALSTLRTGLGSLLADDLIIPNTENIINDFMKTNMKVFWIEHPDNKSLINSNEEILISEIKPLLNLKQNSNSWKTAKDNPTKLYKSRRNLIENNTKKRLGFESKSDNLIIKSEIEDSKSNKKSSIINEHKFELNNEEYILSWHDNPRLTKNGNKQKVKPLLIEYIKKNNLPIQIINNNGNDEVSHTLARNVLKHFSNNTIKIQTVLNSIKLEVKPTLINTTSNFSNSTDIISTSNKEKLFLIPCCKKKIQDIELENRKFDINKLEFNNELGEYRKELIDKLIISELNNTHKRKINKTKNNIKIIEILNITNEFNFNRTAQAHKLYSKGKLYHSNSSDSINWTQKDKEKIYIFSALFGIVRADNYIPLYDLAMIDEIDKQVKFPQNFWNGKLDSIIERLSNNGYLICNLLSGDYSKSLKKKTLSKITKPENKFTDRGEQKGKWLKNELKKH